MATTSDKVAISWQMLYEYVVVPRRYDLADSIKSGSFWTFDGERFLVSGIDTSTDDWRVICTSDSEGSTDYSISTLASNKLNPLEVSQDSMTSSLIRTMDQYNHHLNNQSIALSNQRAEAAKSNRYNTGMSKALPEQLVRLEHEYREHLEQRASRIDFLEFIYASARVHFISSTEISIGLDLSVLLPPVLDWEDLIRLPGEHTFEKLTPDRVQELIGILAEFAGEDAGSFLRPCHALRVLWEPQVVIAIGERLLDQGETVIVPSYAGALLDLDFNQDACDICREYWEEAKRKSKPQFLARAYFRAAGRLGYSKTQDEIRKFATGKFDLGGPGSSLPKRLRNSRRQQVKAHRVNRSQPS